MPLPRRPDGEVHGESGGAYGSPRVTAELRAKGLRINEKRVARVMRTFSITGIRLRRRVRTTVADPAASQVPDLFQRDFTATEPGRKYMGDITYLPLAGGGGEFLYLATVLDCFSRKVVGWSIADHMRTGLVVDALQMAASARGGLDGAVCVRVIARLARFSNQVSGCSLGTPMATSRARSSRPHRHRPAGPHGPARRGVQRGGGTLDWIDRLQLTRDTMRELLVKTLGGAMRAIQELDPSYPATKPARCEA